MSKEQDKVYTDFVAGLVKPGGDILDEMTPRQAEMLHMAIGVSGESGELLDAIKKYVIYQKPLDEANALEELGDVEFFLEGLRQVLNISREDAIAHNMAKLSKRYPKGYSNKAAAERADKS